jgi:hypothetical protein
MGSDQQKLTDTLRRIAPYVLGDNKPHFSAVGPEWRCAGKRFTGFGPTVWRAWVEWYLCEQGRFDMLHRDSL